MRTGLLICPVTFGGRLGTQPQRDMLRPHRLPDYLNQLVAEGAHVCLVPELRREGFEGLGNSSSIKLVGINTRRIHAHEENHAAVSARLFEPVLFSSQYSA
jgi:hypothetical protein